MAYLHDDVLDAALNEIKNNADALCLTSAEATTYTEATATYLIADVTVDTNDFTLDDGASSGRELNVGAQTGMAIDNDGTATHWALVDTGNSKLLATGALSASQAFASPNTAGTAAFIALTLPDAT